MSPNPPNTIPDLQWTIGLPEEVKRASEEGNLIIFIGAGISKLVGVPLWDELAARIIKDLHKQKDINYYQAEQLKSLDAKKILSIAKVISSNKGYELKYEKHLQKSKSENITEDIYETINNIDCVFVTTNYDKLLAPKNSPRDDKTAEEVQRVIEPNNFLDSLDKPEAVIHLHGCISTPKSMVVTTKDYLEHYDREPVKKFLKNLFQKKTVVFFGYGLEEAEILEYILRRGDVRKGQQPVPEATNPEATKHFFVQGFFRSENYLYENLHTYYNETFGVELLGFIMDNIGHEAVKETIKDWATMLKSRKPPLLFDQIESLRKDLIDG